MSTSSLLFCAVTHTQTRSYSQAEISLQLTEQRKMAKAKLSGGSRELRRLCPRLLLAVRLFGKLLPILDLTIYGLLNVI